MRVYSHSGKRLEGSTATAVRVMCNGGFSSISWHFLYSAALFIFLNLNVCHSNWKLQWNWPNEQTHLQSWLGLTATTLPPQSRPPKGTRLPTHCLCVFQKTSCRKVETPHRAPDNKHRHPVLSNRGQQGPKQRPTPQQPSQWPRSKEQGTGLVYCWRDVSTVTNLAGKK